MKKVFFLNILILLFSTCVVSCQAQLMKTIQDAPELVKNKDGFIDKPLKNFLEEIKPSIASLERNSGRDG